MSRQTYVIIARLNNIFPSADEIHSAQVRQQWEGMPAHRGYAIDLECRWMVSVESAPEIRTVTK